MTPDIVYSHTLDDFRAGYVAALSDALSPSSIIVIITITITERMVGTDQLPLIGAEPPSAAAAQSTLSR